MKKVLTRIFLGFNFLVILAMTATYFFVYIPPDSFWYASVFAIGYPYLLWINLGFVIFWAFFKPRYLFLSLVIVLAGWNYISRYVQLNGKNSRETGTKVLSYNIRHFSELGEDMARETSDSIISFLKKEQPQIICLQEALLRTNHIFNLPKLVSEFDFIEHYHYASTAYFGGIVTLTKYPIINMGEIRFENSGNMAIFTDVVIRQDTLRIFNLHLQSFQIDPNRYNVLESPGISESEDIREMREMGGKFKRASMRRAEQARIIQENIKWSPYPVLVCGDFNDTPFSYTYRKVREKLKDAFVESGKGLGNTYIGNLPSFRIDFIIHDQEYDSYNYKESHIPYSDHLPVSCTLVKK